MCIQNSVAFVQIHCRNCSKIINVCASCFRGQKYCGSECRRLKRLDQKACAGKRYSSSEKGKTSKKQRNQRYRSKSQRAKPADVGIEDIKDGQPQAEFKVINNETACSLMPHIEPEAQLKQDQSLDGEFGAMPSDKPPPPTGAARSTPKTSPTPPSLPQEIKRKKPAETHQSSKRSATLAKTLPVGNFVNRCHFCGREVSISMQDSPHPATAFRDLARFGKEKHDRRRNKG